MCRPNWTNSYRWAIEVGLHWLRFILPHPVLQIRHFSLVVAISSSCFLGYTHFSFDQFLVTYHQISHNSTNETQNINWMIYWMNLSEEKHVISNCDMNDTWKRGRPYEWHTLFTIYKIREQKTRQVPSFTGLPPPPHLHPSWAGTVLIPVIHLQAKLWV